MNTRAVQNIQTINSTQLTKLCDISYFNPIITFCSFDMHMDKIEIEYEKFSFTIHPSKCFFYFAFFVLFVSCFLEVLLTFEVPLESHGAIIQYNAKAFELTTIKFECFAPKTMTTTLICMKPNGRQKDIFAFVCTIVYRITPIGISCFFLFSINEKNFLFN